MDDGMDEWMMMNGMDDENGMNGMEWNGMMMMMNGWMDDDE